LTKSEQPLQIELRPAWRLAAVAGFIHLLSAGSIVLLPAFYGLRFLLPVLLLVHFGYFIRRKVIGTTRKAVRMIAWDRQRGWRVANAAGDWQRVHPDLPVFVSYKLVVVRFRISAFRSRSAIVVAERLSDDDFRRLRVRLIQSAKGIHEL